MRIVDDAVRYGVTVKVVEAEVPPPGSGLRATFILRNRAALIRVPRAGFG